MSALAFGLRIRAAIPPVPLGHSRCHRSSSGVLVAEGFFPVKLQVLLHPGEQKPLGVVPVALGFMPWEML